MANLEQEYKFGLPNNWSHFTLTNYDLIRGHVIDIKRYDMVAEDYDTEDSVLNNAGHSLRRRTENDEVVYTLKVLRENTNGKRVRTEYEVADDVTLNGAISAMFLEAIDKEDEQCQKLIARIAAPMVEADNYASHLMRWRTRDFTRYEYTIEFRDVIIAIAVDIGIKITDEGTPNEKTARIRKIDLEYKDGNIETFEKYVQAFEFTTGLVRIYDAATTDLNYDL